MRIRTAANRDGHPHKVVSDDGREAHPYCLPQARAAKERPAAGRFGQALTEPSEGLSEPRTRKRIDRDRQRIGRPEARSRPDTPKTSGEPSNGSTNPITGIAAAIPAIPVMGCA